MKSAPRALAVKSSTQQAPYVTSPITMVSASVNLENTKPRLKMTPRRDRPINSGDEGTKIGSSCFRWRQDALLHLTAPSVRDRLAAGRSDTAPLVCSSSPPVKGPGVAQAVWQLKPCQTRDERSPLDQTEGCAEGKKKPMMRASAGSRG